ncbi:MAG TPA: alpha/beta hydrolase [Gaiellaceae bacterium]|nr:alpha/beta hydrolase [Gaiellaceae bacterium]
MRRWSRRVGIAFVSLLAALTLAAIAFDLATNGESRPATALYHGPFVRVGRTLVAYRRWGRVGSPIVLLAGAAEPTWVWHTVAPLLAARGHRVYALDLPPFGYTQRHGPYTMAGWLTLVEGFERRLAIRRPLLVGHSLGAGVAAAEALARPHSVGGIVLLDGDALPFGGGHGWLTDLLVYPFYPALFRLATGSDWLVSHVLAGAWGRLRPHFTHTLLSVFERPFRVQGTADGLKQLVRNGIPGVTRAQLGRLTVPRAVVWGSQDDVDSRSGGEATAEALHVPLTLIPNAGHLSMLANPPAVAAAIETQIATDRRERRQR